MKSAKFISATIFGLGVLCVSGWAFARSQAVPVAFSPKDVRVQYPVQLVELFTSQGCSSCPRANGRVRELSRKEGVLALSYSVDCWDYLGWKDTFGKPKFSARQREYGEKFQTQVYTPQIVLNGKQHAPHFSDKQLRQHVLPIQDKPAASGKMRISRTTSGNMISIPAHRFSIPVTITAVTYSVGEQSVQVVRGENQGRTLLLSNVVRDIKHVGRAQIGVSFLDVLPDIGTGEALAVLVQSEAGGDVLSVINYTP